MKYFKIFYSIGGKKSTTLIVATHKYEALQKFKENPLGIFIAIKEVGEPLNLKFEVIKKQILQNSGKKRVAPEPYIASLRQLGVMLNAGIALNQCFDEIINTTTNKQLKKIFSQIHSDVEAGVSLTKSFQKFSYELGNISASIVDLGEQTGTLAKSITKLADILHETNENKKKLKKAIRYPMIVMITMTIAFIAIIKLVVPNFKDMFSELNAALPMPTQLLLWIEKFISNYGILILIVAIALVFFHKATYLKNRKYKYLIDKYILKVYLLGRVTSLSMIGRFIYVFNSLTNSGIPIVEAIKTARSTVDNDFINEKFLLIENSIQEGKSLTHGFGITKQFENMILQMIKAGESSGSLNQMLEKVDDYYNTKYNDLIDNLSTYIEPIMIFFIAGFLLLMAMGVFLPMWDMAGAIDQ